MDVGDRGQRAYHRVTSQTTAGHAPPRPPPMCLKHVTSSSTFPRFNLNKLIEFDFELLKKNKLPASRGVTAHL